NEIARLDPRDRAAGARHLAERFVPDHQIRRTIRRRAVIEAADLPVGAANADVDHAQQHVVVTFEFRFGMVVDYLDALLVREYSDGSHGFSSWAVRRRCAHRNSMR